MLEQDVEGRMEQGKVLAGGTVLGGPPSQIPRGRDGFVAPLAQLSPLLPSSSLLGTEARATRAHRRALPLVVLETGRKRGAHESPRPVGGPGHGGRVPSTGP